jgi:hypothetical protein
MEGRALKNILAVARGKILHVDWSRNTLRKGLKDVLSSCLSVDRTQSVEVPIVMESKRSGRMASACGSVLADVRCFVGRRVIDAGTGDQQIAHGRLLFDLREAWWLVVDAELRERA